jgi:cell migration-inducing and hyaluronan-binding protein
VSKRHHSFLLASLLPAFLLVSVFAVVHAQEGKSPAVKQTRWSDAATWPDRKVPVAGDKVTIAAGKDVLLDVSPPALGGLTIDGKLSFANNKDLELTTEWVMLHGELEIGTEVKPHTRKATITFTNNVKDEDFGGMGGNDRSDRGIMIMGGTLSLHGDRKNSWTKLASTANAGSTSIQVLDASGWRVGDEIVSRPRISIPGRPSGAPLPPSRATRSRSTRNWTTCTSARSPSTWMNAAKSGC